MQTPAPQPEPAAGDAELRLALEAGEIGTWQWDLGSGRMSWSAQMFRNLGLEPAADGDLYPALLRAVHRSERQSAATAFAEFRTRPGPLRIELRLAAAPEEEPRWIVFLGEVAAGADGAPLVMRGITIGSTRRRKVEETAAAALRDSEQRLRELNRRLARRAAHNNRQLDASRAQIQAIFDNSPDWLTLFRARSDGRFVYEDLNRATETAYGLERDKVIGRPLEEILGVEPAQLPLRLMRACIATGENQRYTARRTMAGKTYAIDVMFARVPEKHDGDYFIMATARDLTEREALEERLRQSQKIEAIGQLTGGVAHDFNNLLTAVIGNLELLGPRVAGDPAALKYLAGAQRAAEHGAALTEQLLAFSRRQHLQPRAVNLNTIVVGMRDLLARTIGPAIRVNTVLAAELWPALVDPTQIEVAILNLAINARDAMPFGGTLSIETCNLERGAETVPAEIGDHDCICISVRDTGTGMSEEVLRSAVEPFFTTKEAGKGSGLGLSQVYGMARQSNGTLAIESRLGTGTAVHLYFPATAAADAAGDGPDRPQRQKASARILVVDDDPAVREVTVQILRQMGHGVTEADSGQAALEALVRGEDCDLMVIDIAMPGLSGIETVERARLRQPGLRVLYVTGYADLAGTGLRSADDPWIKKPFRLTDLTAAVDAGLRREPAVRHRNVVPLPRRP